MYKDRLSNIKSVKVIRKYKKDLVEKLEKILEYENIIKDMELKKEK